MAVPSEMKWVEWSAEVRVVQGVEGSRPQLVSEDIVEEREEVDEDKLQVER